MQLLTISDEVVPTIYSLNIKERFGGAACVLSCGDLPYYYMEFAISMLNVPCYYIHGNHDTVEYTSGGEEVAEPRGCVSLEGRTIHHDGLLLAGLGGCVRYNDEPGAQYTDREMLMRVWRLTPRLIFNKRRYGRYLDIFLTHAPPHGIHNGPDRAHRGFRAFLGFMDRFKPHYLIHGHIHRSYGFSAVTETHYKATTVINTAGYRTLNVETLPTQPTMPNANEDTAWSS